MPQPETLDLTTEQPAEDGLVALSQRPYSFGDQMEERREQTRSDIARWLILALVAVLIFSVLYVIVITVIVSVSGTITTDDVVALVQGIGSALLTPLVGLIGAVTGFYYGGQTSRQREGGRTDTRG